MNLSPEQLSAIASWQAGSRKLKQGALKRKQRDLAEVQEILGLQSGSIAREDYELDGHFAYPTDVAKFDPDDIEEELDPSRYEEISSGQEPTADELQIWAKKKDSLVFEGDCGWYHFYLWRIDFPNEQLYFRSLHGDGGILDFFDGPFGSEEEALDGAGNLEINPRPQPQYA